jgi:Na+(H+)/acetate symporter ActP
VGNTKFVSENTMLFKPMLAAGIIVEAFGVICIWIGTSVISPKEEGEDFEIIGIRFLIGGMVSITLAFIAKYVMLIKYLLKQISYKGYSCGDKFSDWNKP